MEYDIQTILNASKQSLKRAETLAGDEIPRTYDAYLVSTRDSAIYEVEMLMWYNNYAYELEGKCIPFLVQKLKKKLTGAEKGQLLQMDVDLAFSECADFLDAVFVGGMGCERMLSPHPLRSKASVHDIMVNMSKTRTQLTEKLLEALRSATNEVLITGWVGRYIIPDLKKCVERGVEVKIVTHRPEEAVGSVGVKDKADAFSELRQFIKSDNVSLLPSCHARMVVIDETIVFVGSMDLDSQAMAERDEAAMMSNDTEVVGKTRKIFKELFDKGTRPKW
jgi:hypothetical protein